MVTDYGSIVNARLSIQRALLGEVPPNLRAVVFSADEQSLDVRFYFDGVIADDDRESASCVETEIIADYDSKDKVIVRCIQLNAPEPINDNGVWVYQRNEMQPGRR